MPSVLVVCTANICRSPVGEAVLRERLHKAGKAHWQVSSAGTWAYPGQAASTLSVQLMGEQGLDIRNHQSRVVDEAVLAETDLILCMERNHAEALRAEFPQFADRVYLLSEMSGQNHSVTDPFGGPRPDYVRMVNEVTELIEEGLERIIELAQANASAVKG